MFFSKHKEKIANKFEEHHKRGDVFVQYHHIWKELTFSEKFIECLLWFGSLFIMIIFGVIILFIFGAVVGGLNAIFMGI